MTTPTYHCLHPATGRTCVVAHWHCVRYRRDGTVHSAAVVAAKDREEARKEGAFVLVCPVEAVFVKYDGHRVAAGERKVMAR